MSDLLDVSQTPEEPAPKKASKQILRSEILEGLDVRERDWRSLFMSGLSAGLDIGFSVLLMAVMWTQAHDHLPAPLVHILMANMYAAGFIFVILGRSELFTEQTTLAVLPVLNRSASIYSLLRIWSIVLLANLIGGAIFARIVTIAGPALGTVNREAFGEMAHRLTDHSNGVIMLSAMLAGWLMGLLSWLIAAARDTISQIVLVWLITTSIGFAGLHHVIVGAVEVFAGFFAGQDVTGHDVIRVLVSSTLGNIFGGTVFVALIKYGPVYPGVQAKSHEAHARKDWDL